MNRLEERACQFEQEFTFRVWQIDREGAVARVRDAWLAGYKAAQHAALLARAKRNKKNG
jgi:hypothetical protein